MSHVNAFLRAVRAGDVALVTQLLDEGNVTVNASNESGNTALMEAAQRDSLDVLQLLLNERTGPFVSWGKSSAVPAGRSETGSMRQGIMR